MILLLNGHFGLWMLEKVSSLVTSFYFLIFLRKSPKRLKLMFAWYPILQIFHNHKNWKGFWIKWINIEKSVSKNPKFYVTKIKERAKYLMKFVYMTWSPNHYFDREREREKRLELDNQIKYKDNIVLYFWLSNEVLHYHYLHKQIFTMPRNYLEHALIIIFF